MSPENFKTRNKEKEERDKKERKEGPRVKPNFELLILRIFCIL